MWDQNKSFLSVRTAESNRKRTWFQSPSLVFWESNCLSGGKRYFKKWKNRILIFVYFLFQTLSFSCVEILCALVTNWVWLTFSKGRGNWLRTDSGPSHQCFKALFWSRKEKKKKVSAETPESSFPFLSPKFLLSSEDPPVARSGGNGSGLHCESKSISQTPEGKSISRRWRKKEATTVRLVNPSQEMG